MVEGVFQHPARSLAGNPGSPQAVVSLTSVKGGVILGHGVSKFRGNVRLSVQQKCHLLKPESTEGRPWGQPLKKAEGAPLNLG